MKSFVQYEFRSRGTCLSHRTLKIALRSFHRPLLIKELDKTKPSEYKLMFALLNAVFEAGGMIISTSNYKAGISAPVSRTGFMAAS